MSENEKDPTNTIIESAKVLLVGAGGIGCEVLKNLVLSGFRHVEVVDMDTIELTNLNRQFLFRKHHIGQPKSVIACQAVQSMAPEGHELCIIPHVANIKDLNRFPLSFYHGFSIVLNALDNVEARRWVNQQCLMARVPLVESGTAGYFGQSTVIVPRRTECYDCQPRDAPKTFPVCTIRNTPTAIIHCIVWAKDYVLANLFGDAQPSSSEDSDKDAIEFSRIKDISDVAQLEEEIFCKLFNRDIVKLAQMPELWESRKAPEPLLFEAMPKEHVSLGSLDEHLVWTFAENFALYRDSLLRLYMRSKKEGLAFSHPIVFDKDDQDTLDFVTSLSNLRAHVFSIPLESRWKIKSMAGNIIPAIATTNAIAAGMVVSQAINLLCGKLSDCSTAFITFGSRRDELFVRGRLCLPNPDCAVCHNHRALVYANPETLCLRTILSDLLEDFVFKLREQQVENDLNFEDHALLPNLEELSDEVCILEGSRIIYDPEMSSDGTALDRTLADFGIADGSLLRLDFLEGPALILGIIKDDSFEAGEYQAKFDLIPMAQLADASRKRKAAAAAAEEKALDDQNKKHDIVIDDSDIL